MTRGRIGPALAGVLGAAGELARPVAFLLLLASGARAQDLDAVSLEFEPRLAAFAQDMHEEEFRAGELEEWYGLSGHRGMFFRFGGMVVEQQNDAVRRTGEPVTFETGGGLSLAMGYRFFGMPLSLELEYAFRTVDAEAGSFDDEADIDLHTITANLAFDETDLFGPVGLYAGVGAGTRIEEFRYTSVNGSATSEINGTGFFWQARGGITVSLGARAQLYAGIVWSDADDIEDDQMRVDAEMLSAEIGLRLFF